MERRSYKIKNIIINQISIDEVIIDPHVDKHADHISDEFILELVRKLDDTEHVIDSIKNNFSFFISEIEFETKLYKMVWLLEKNKFYVGVITAFKDRRLK